MELQALRRPAKETSPETRFGRTLPGRALARWPKELEDVLGQDLASLCLLGNVHEKSVVFGSVGGEDEAEAGGRSPRVKEQRIQGTAGLLGHAFASTGQKSLSFVDEKDQTSGRLLGPSEHVMQLPDRVAAHRGNVTSAHHCIVQARRRREPPCNHRLSGAGWPVEQDVAQRRLKLPGAPGYPGRQQYPVLGAGLQHNIGKVLLDLQPLALLFLCGGQNATDSVIRRVLVEQIKPQHAKELDRQPASHAALAKQARSSDGGFDVLPRHGRRFLGHQGHSDDADDHEHEVHKPRGLFQQVESGVPDAIHDGGDGLEQSLPVRLRLGRRAAFSDVLGLSEKQGLGLCLALGSGDIRQATTLLQAFLQRGATLA
eukprot:scaffold7092_cov262-Pinguiococcus_pyrenoidosus.AAC.42